MSWVREFCVRNFLVYREATHQSQQKLRDHDFECETVKQYLMALNSLTKNFDRSSVYIIDETPAYYDMVPTRTLETVGTKTVDLLNSGHDKTRFSLILTVRADGFLLPIGIFLKGLTKVPKFI